ncbi:activating transcription factor 7-interacting protein 1 [Calliphora vicina]|uniref:activating transcription factor 7-interacting protein 1 n=1 Tax=Calliphora vicina TaxID=7373 RepID=UPI00325BF901
MMEVKQNTAVDLNDLLTSPKSSGTDEVDDGVMSDLTDRTHDLVKCDLIKANDKIENSAELGNGDAEMVSLISDVDVDADLNASVNTELEDALLAEDDVMPKITNTKALEATSSPTDDILADKVETSNSTTSSNNVRDPGDDLDTLLSKINDIVEDCIDNENENTVNNTLKSEQAINKIAETQKESNLPESMLFEEESKVNHESSDVKGKEISEDTTEQATIDNEINSLEHSEATKNETKEETKSPNLPTATQVLENNIGEVKEENKRSDIDENDTSVAETQLDTGKDSSEENCCDTVVEDDYQNQDKTEELTAEAVQDNEITSNSNELLEAVKTPSPPKVDADKMSSTEVSDTTEINDVPQNTDKAVDNTETTTSQIEDKTSTEAIKTSGSGENYDSDDEIVFYVDKPPEIEESKETETKSMETDTETKTTSATENSTSQKETPSSPKKIVEDDDDIVLLLDDEDEEVDQIKNEKEKTEENSSKKLEEQQVADEAKIFKDPNAAVEAKDINIDNSDNARDDFLNENSNENDKSVEKPEVTETPDETNSNCSSSSNLLQEAKSIKTSVEEPAPEEPENEEEEDEGDVELIESELKATETSEKLEDSESSPPTKRIRLSEDSEQSSKTEESSNEPKDDASPKAMENKKESQETMEEEKSSEETCSTLKRTHDAIEVEAEEKSNDSKVSNEGVNKKPRTDDLKAETEDSSEKPVEIKDDKSSEDIKPEEDDKKDIKAVPSYQPIPLYPPPKFQVLKSEPAISLDFLKKFRKSFDNMTKQDLEELVLQKVVEAIIHRSEFSEMRELIEKQEKLITAHRSKISELSKQFRDLEMVHNRVVKDIEQRNSQFIMPVKITRAVGLQVYIPNKKSITETASSSTGPSNVPSSPQRPVSSQTVTASSTLTPPQRQYISSQTETQQQQRPGPTSSAVPANTANVRRGCVQKITPIRPVPGSNQSSSSAGPTTAPAAYRNTATQPRILNKNATPIVNPTSIQRSRYLGSNQDGQRIPSQQQISRPPSMPANSQRVVANAAAQPKSSTNVTTAVQRRSEPIPPSAAASSSSSIVDNYINTLTHLTGGNTAVSITPAKPKEKAVIDLTDEDETPGQTPSVQPATQVPVTQVPRRSLPGQNTANSQLQYGRAAPPLARIPPGNQMANNKNRQLSSLQAQKSGSFTSISTPPGTSITRINVPPNATSVQRVKYSHPAPLPATPPQAFNPAWKLPPPRPTIRISNLDNGIVISWTMEESMDRHAECVSYQIYAYQETSGPPMVDSWRHVGDVKAMLLPMAVTLTQFQEGQRYYFAVRAVDCHQRFGPFSLPKTWS